MVKAASTDRVTRVALTKPTKKRGYRAASHSTTASSGAPPPGCSALNQEDASA